MTMFCCDVDQGLDISNSVVSDCCGATHKQTQKVFVGHSQMVLENAELASFNRCLRQLLPQEEFNLRLATKPITNHSSQFT